MSARTTILHATAFTMDGTSYLGDLEMVEIDANIEDDDCNSAASEWGKQEETKRTVTFRFEVMLKLGTTAACHYTNLHLGVFSWDGSSILGDIKSATIKTSIDTDDGSGVADFDTYVNPVGRQWTMEFNKMKATGGGTETFMTAMMAGANDASRKKTVVFTISDSVGGSNAITFTAPMRIQSLKHSLQRKKIQTWSGTLKSNGTPSSPSSGGTHLLNVAFVGDGVITLNIDSGAGEYSATALVTECECQVEDSKIIKISGTLQAQGAVTYE